MINISPSILLKNLKVKSKWNMSESEGAMLNGLNFFGFAEE